MDISRSRAAVAAGFLTQGLVFLSLTTRLPEFQDRWDLSDVDLSLILLMMVLLAGAGSVVAEALAQARATAHCCSASGCSSSRSASPVLCTAPVVGALRRRRRGVRRRARRRRRDHEHAGGRARAPLRPPDPAVLPRRLDPRRRRRRGRSRWPPSHLPLEACAALAVVPLLVVAFAPFLPRDHGPTELPEALAVPWRPILLVGLGMVLFYMVDTAAQTWGPMFLDHTFGTSRALVALSTLLLPARQPAGAAGRRRPGRAVRPGAGPAGRRRRRRGRARGRGLLAHLAGRGARLHAARRRRLRGRAAELLGRRPDRRRRRARARRSGRPGSTR